MLPRVGLTVKPGVGPATFTWLDFIQAGILRADVPAPHENLRVANDR